MGYLLYALTLFLSSALLFSVQPMVGKMLLPVLGGSPAVWNTCMVFFQACLLGGYLYAHLSTRWLGCKRQTLLHMPLMLVALIVLPISVQMPGESSAFESPAMWLLLTLTLSVGLPFFVISTSAPLLQKWFSQTNHPDASDPYHLYAASNVGSFLALLAYPFLIEPNLGLVTQSRLWMGAYVVLCLLVGASAYYLWRTSNSLTPAVENADDIMDLRPIAWRRRLQWIVWAFIPSSLMLSVTTYITTDIAPIPLLWVGPLMLYLLTFILAFARHQVIKTRWVLYILPLFCIPLGLLFIVPTSLPAWFLTSFHFATLFVVALAFHGLIADDRPETHHLTEFFLWISVGGVLGGLFNALLAPLVFNRILEYPLLLVVVALTLPTALFQDRIFRAIMGIVIPISVGWGIWSYFDLGAYSLDLKVLFGCFVACSLVLLGMILHYGPRWLQPILGIGALAVVIFSNMDEDYELHVERSFFAMHRVSTSTQGYFHKYHHGNTSHGVQSRHEDYERMALSYYHLSGPIGQVFEELGTREKRNSVAIVGLGTGALASYVSPGQKFDFYEIDPTVESIARNPELFTYLHHCGEQCDVIIGDGRLQLARAPDHHYELIVLDAYSSTAIPIHLLTREAIEIYLSKLTDDGIIAFHISNRHLDLEPPLTRLAEAMNLAVLAQDYWVEDTDLYNIYVDHSDWMILARDVTAFGELFNDTRWKSYAPMSDVAIWTDDYANVLQTYRW